MPRQQSTLQQHILREALFHLKVTSPTYANMKRKISPKNDPNDQVTYLSFPFSKSKFIDKIIKYYNIKF